MAETDDSTEMAHRLWEETPGILRGMKDEIRELTSAIYHTSKWRMIKRYRLFEKREKLDGDYGLLVHVMFDDEDPWQ